MKVLLRVYKFVAFKYCTEFDIVNCLNFLKHFSLIVEETDIIVGKKIQLSLHHWVKFSLIVMATLRNKKISGRSERKTWKYKEQSVPEQTWSRNGSRIHLPSFKEIEGRVKKKTFKWIPPDEITNFGCCV